MPVTIQEAERALEVAISGVEDFDAGDEDGDLENREALDLLRAMSSALGRMPVEERERFLGYVADAL